MGRRPADPRRVTAASRTWKCAAGVVISASHNPADDNGIKVLGPGGEKIDDEVERQLENADCSMWSRLQRTGLPAGRCELADELSRTARWPPTTSPRPLDGMHIVLDCANGAASEIGPAFFERLGARVTVIAASPDGTNINHDCGATSPQNLVDRVLAEGADAGLALDGDADRAILVDERGRLARRRRHPARLGPPSQSAAVGCPAIESSPR